MSRSREYFDRIAGEWDELRRGFFTDAAREKALALADVQPGRAAADIGAGTGYVTAALVERGVAVIAVDASRPMLAALADKLPPRAEVECRQGDAEALPIEDGAVDYAFASMLLHHAESPPTVIREMARILKPGGTLVLTDLDRHDFEFLVSQQRDRWMGFDRDQVREWLVEAGLVDARVDCVGADCRATSDAGEAATVSLFAASARRPR